MSEWWTYRLSDFLMFSPATYWRLVGAYNGEVWPAHLAALAGGFTALWLGTARSAGPNRGMAVLLALAWLWVGWAFHWQRYASINWAAAHLAAAFALQALLLAAVGLMPPRTDSVLPGLPARRLGWVLVALGLVLYPAAGRFAGRPWEQAEVFGIAPEPTALATLGMLLVARHAPPRGLRWVLAVIPLLSLLAGAATLWAMAD